MAGATPVTTDVLAAPSRTERLRAAYAHMQADRFDAMEPCCRADAATGDVEHMMMLGISLAMRGEVEESSALFAHVASARPEIIHPVDDLARLLIARGRDLDALPHAEAAVRHRPDDVRALVALGLHLTTHTRPVEAEAVLRRAQAIAPRGFNVLNQLAIALTEQGRYAEGIALFRDAAALEPGNSVAWTNLACTLATEGGFDEALACYRRAITLKPDHAAIRLNHAICLLKAGRGMQGWAEYEWRLRLPGHTELPLDRLLANLDDDTRLDGEVILVTQEEGLGDTLQFMRYLPALRDRGATVVAWVPPVLRSLLARIDGISVLDGEVERLTFGRHCPFISLPRAFSATTDALPGTPYLTVDPARIASMRPHLPQTSELLVGLVWGGAPRPENRQAFSVDRRRSIGLAALAPLAGVTHTRLVSLQLGPYREQLGETPPGLALHDPMSACADMEDTAALIDGLDVVLSVDTAIVHLAGGMGKPVLLLDRYDNCWRWGHGRDDSLWYPSLRIIRQSSPGDWNGVVRRAVAALQAMADDKRRGQPVSAHSAMAAIEGAA